MGFLGSLEATVEPCRIRLNDGTVLTDFKPQEVPVISVEDYSTSLLESKSQVR